MGHSGRMVGRLAGMVVAVALAGCGGSAGSGSGAGGAGASAGGGANSGGGAGSAQATSPAGGGNTGGGGNGGGTTADICSLFTAAEIGTLLGKTTTKIGPTAGEAQSCSWGTDDLTTVYLYRTTPSECDDTRSNLTSTGSVQGADFAGQSSTLGASFAGKVSGGACYVVEVAPAERAPSADVVGQLLAQLLQRAGG